MIGNTSVSILESAFVCSAEAIEHASEWPVSGQSLLIGGGILSFGLLLSRKIYAFFCPTIPLTFNLPLELIGSIFHYLPEKDQLALTATCKKLFSQRFNIQGPLSSLKLSFSLPLEPRHLSMLAMFDATKPNPYLKIRRIEALQDHVSITLTTRPTHSEMKTVFQDMLKLVTIFPKIIGFDIGVGFFFISDLATLLRIAQTRYTQKSLNSLSIQGMTSGECCHSMEELPIEISFFTGLKALRIINFLGLKRLPNFIVDLSLDKLYLDRLFNLRTLPEGFVEKLRLLDKEKTSYFFGELTSLVGPQLKEAGYNMYWDDFRGGYHVV